MHEYFKQTTYEDKFLPLLCWGTSAASASSFLRGRDPNPSMQPTVVSRFLLLFSRSEKLLCRFVDFSLQTVSWVWDDVKFSSHLIALAVISGSCAGIFWIHPVVPLMSRLIGWLWRPPIASTAVPLINRLIGWLWRPPVGPLMTRLIEWLWGPWMVLPSPPLTSRLSQTCMQFFDTCALGVTIR